MGDVGELGAAEFPGFLAEVAWRADGPGQEWVDVDCGLPCISLGLNPLAEGMVFACGGPGCGRGRGVEDFEVVFVGLVDGFEVPRALDDVGVFFTGAGLGIEGEEALGVDFGAFEEAVFKVEGVGGDPDAVL